MKTTAIAIFTAWQKGEAGNGYGDFNNLLDEEGFNNFSHPLLGNYSSKEGYAQLKSLVAERELKPNNLAFSNTVIYSNGNKFCFQFDSEGSVNCGYPYKGFNMIEVEIMNQKLTGFREYFGFIDPAWFK